MSVFDDFQDIKLAGNKKIVMLSQIENSSPYIVSFLFPGYQAAVLVRMLSQKEIYIAAGSACQAETNTPNKTLSVLGYSGAAAYSMVRCSFWLQNTTAEVDRFCHELQVVINSY